LVPRDFRVGLAFPFPGGWTLGCLLLVNLLAAHALRFRLSWQRSGVLILHSGLILLMLNEFITGVWAIEGNMVIDEGQTSNVVLHPRFFELAVAASGQKEDAAMVVPGWMLQNPGPVHGGELPFDIEVLRWVVNTSLRKPEP